MTWRRGGRSTFDARSEGADSSNSPACSRIAANGSVLMMWSELGCRRKGVRHIRWTGWWLCIDADISSLIYLRDRSFGVLRLRIISHEQRVPAVRPFWRLQCLLSGRDMTCAE